MKHSSVALRSFGILTLVDFLFIVPVGGALSVVDGLRFWGVLAIFGPLSALRIAGYWWLFARWVGPAERLHVRAGSGRTLTEADVRTADAGLQSAPAVLAKFAGVCWSVSLVVTAVLHHLIVAPPELRSLEVPVLLLFFVLGALGPAGICLPLLALLFADLSGEIFLLAEQRAVDLERPQRSVASRTGLLALCLTIVPITLLGSAALSEQSQGNYAAAEQAARALAGDLRYVSLTKGAAAALPALQVDLDPARTTAVILDPSGEVATAGAPLPGWATPEYLTAASRGAVAPVDRATAVHSVELPSGHLASAIVRMEGADSTFVALLATVLLAVGLYAAVGGGLFSRSLAVPLERTAELARRAAREGDLSKMGTLPVAQHDEVGRVTVNLNELLDSMRSIAAAAGDVGEGRLGVSIEATGELPDAFRRMLGQLRDVVQEMLTTATELQTATTEIFAASQEQEAAATSHSTGMSEITQTMDSLSESAAHVASAVQGVLENAERTRSNTDQMVKRIDELTAHAHRIGDILDIIREIADRTDLLALNGSLEATRAGEAGLGFSIVASEMRRLAERVTASVGDIKTLVDDIRESGASTVVATEESKKLADATTNAARAITLVTQQQQSSTDQVSENVRAVAEVVRQSATATSQTRASAEGLKGQAERLATLVRRFQLAE